MKCEEMYIGLFYATRKLSDIRVVEMGILLTVQVIFIRHCVLGVKYSIICNNKRVICYVTLQEITMYMFQRSETHEKNKNTFFNTEINISLQIDPGNNSSVTETRAQGPNCKWLLCIAARIS